MAGACFAGFCRIVNLKDIIMNKIYSEPILKAESLVEGVKTQAVK